MDKIDDVQGSIENANCWKGISLRRLEECTENMKKLSGLDSKDIKSYKVGFILDQDYGTAGSFVEPCKNEETKSDEEMGLVEPMVMNNFKEYKGAFTKTTYKKRRRACC